jgi:hypothetical protein
MITTRLALRLMALGAMLAALILLLDPRAHADEGEYLSDLSDHGIPNGSVALGLGYQICADITANGFDGVQHETRLALSTGMPVKTISLLMVTAVADLCPSQMPVLMAWAHSPTPGGTVA